LLSFLPTLFSKSIVNPESIKYHQIGEITRVPFRKLPLKKQIQQLEKEYETGLRDAYLVRFKDGTEICFGIHELQFL